MDEWDVTYIPWDKYHAGWSEEDKVLDRVTGESVMDVARRWVEDGKIIKIELVDRINNDATVHIPKDGEMYVSFSK